MCSYRLDILTVVDGLHPMIVATVENGVPASSIRARAVCLSRWSDNAPLLVCGRIPMPLSSLR